MSRPPGEATSGRASGRVRLDALLVERGEFPSREGARAAVLAGDVTVDGATVTKAGTLVSVEAALAVARRPRFVSRGGEKLAGALERFDVAVARRRAIDVGASTGGFTDCLLQSGAASVVAVDVGYGQLAWKLRTDQRVTVFERLNIRHADPVSLGAPFDIVVVDVSFISLATVLPALVSLMGPGSDLLALVKPQFEAGKGRVGKRGVVRDPQVHADVVRAVVNQLHDQGLVVRGLGVSPIRGPEGNIEFWVHAAFAGEEGTIDVDGLVAVAHERSGD